MFIYPWPLRTQTIIVQIENDTTEFLTVWLSTRMHARVAVQEKEKPFWDTIITVQLLSHSYALLIEDIKEEGTRNINTDAGQE